MFQACHCFTPFSCTGRRPSLCALNKMTTMSTANSLEAHPTFCPLARRVLRLRVSARRQFRGRLAFSYHCKLTMTANLCTPPIIRPPRPPPRLPALARARQTRSQPNTQMCVYICIHMYTCIHMRRSACSVAFTSVACLPPPRLASHDDNKINCNF